MTTAFGKYDSTYRTVVGKKKKKKKKNQQQKNKNKNKNKRQNKTNWIVPSHLNKFVHQLKR